MLALLSSSIKERGSLMLNRTVVVTFALMFAAAFLSLGLVAADPVGDGNYEGPVMIQGSHIVSEGAFFRFEIVNYSNERLSVTIVNYVDYSLPFNPSAASKGDVTYVLARGASITYPVIAPSTRLPFEKVHYFFKVDADGNSSQLESEWQHYTVDYSMYVLSSGFTTFFDYFIPIVIGIAVVFILLFAIMLIKRRRKSLGQKQGNSRSF